MSNCTVKSATTGREADWLRVYNSSAVFALDRVRLSESDINALVQKRLVSLENLLVAYSGKTPSAACRITVDTDSRGVIICDFCSLPARPEAAKNLIDDVLTRARRMSAPLVGIWIDGGSETLANLVSSFSFDVRKIRVRMECTMMSPPAHATMTEAQLLRLTTGHVLGEHELEGRVTLHEMVNVSEMMWRESERLITDHILVNAYTSEASPDTAWILASGQSSIDEGSFAIEEGDLLTLMARLYEKGVRRIWVVTVPEYGIRSVFMSAGFEPRERHFLLGLDLLY